MSGPPTNSNQSTLFGDYSKKTYPENLIRAQEVPVLTDEQKSLLYQEGWYSKQESHINTFFKLSEQGRIPLYLNKIEGYYQIPQVFFPGKGELQLVRAANKQIKYNPLPRISSKAVQLIIDTMGERVCKTNEYLCAFVQSFVHNFSVFGDRLQQARLTLMNDTAKEINKVDKQVFDLPFIHTKANEQEIKIALERNFSKMSIEELITNICLSKDSCRQVLVYIENSILADVERLMLNVELHIPYLQQHVIGSDVVQLFLEYVPSFMSRMVSTLTPFTPEILASFSNCKLIAKLLQLCQPDVLEALRMSLESSPLLFLRQELGGRILGQYLQVVASDKSSINLLLQHIQENQSLLNREGLMSAVHLSIAYWDNNSWKKLWKLLVSNKFWITWTKTGRVGAKSIISIIKRGGKEVRVFFENQFIYPGSGLYEYEKNLGLLGDKQNLIAHRSLILTKGGPTILEYLLSSTTDINFKSMFVESMICGEHDIIFNARIYGRSFVIALIHSLSSIDDYKKFHTLYKTLILKLMEHTAQSDPYPGKEIGRLWRFLIYIWQTSRGSYEVIKSPINDFKDDKIIKDSRQDLLQAVETQPVMKLLHYEPSTDINPEDVPKRKKTRRGKRGGKKNRKRKAEAVLEDRESV